MPYVIEDFYLTGIPQTALVGGLASRGIADHWTAGAPGRAGARGTAQFFVDRADRNASYHEIPWWEQGTRTFGVLRIVRADRAAHSMNPNPPTWAPNAEVRRILGDKVNDPNAVAYARSFAGMPADLERAMRDPFFIECYVRRTRELLAQETTIKVERPLFNHGWGQPTTRTDAGPNLIPAIYARLYGDDDLMARPWRPVTVTWTTGTDAAGRFWGIDKTTGEVIEKQFDTPTEVTTFLEQYELVDGRITSPSDRLLQANYPDPLLGPETITFLRTSLTNPRNVREGLPASGGFTQTDLNKARDAGISAGKADMKSKAVAEATEHLAEVKALA